jgi:O-6-methylguanine DNA methyltransferase
MARLVLGRTGGPFLARGGNRALPLPTMEAKILQSVVIRTAVGNMVAIASEMGLCAFEFDIPGRQELLRSRIAKWFAGAEIRPMDQSEFGQLTSWLGEYFSGRFPDPDALALDLRGTDFERKVWRALQALPPASTVSYSGLAETVGMRGSARAIGSAVRRNPISIIVPCHRVVGSDGSLRGYGGGLPQKEWLLRHEGVQDQGRGTSRTSTRL